MILRLVLILLIALATSTATNSRAWAADFESSFAKLGASGYDDKVAAAQALSDLGDARALPALKALSDGRLYTTSDGKLAIGDDDPAGVKLSDPITGAALGVVGSDKVEKLKANNRLRGAIAGAVAQLSLFSPDTATRLGAAQDALKFTSPGMMAALGRAIAQEKDANVKSALQLSLYGAQLASGSPEEQLAAVRGLAGSSDPQVSGLLKKLRDAPDTPAALKAAAFESLDSITRRLLVIEWLGNIFQGISLGTVLLLAAIGLAITFGVMGVINMAHGEMIMLGAYTTFTVQELFRSYAPGWLDGYLIAAVPVAFIVTGLVGIALERSIIRLLYGRPLETLLATWGISLILQQVARTLYGPDNRAVANPSWMTGGFELIGGFIVTWNRVGIILFSFAVLGLLLLLLRRTSLGLHIRAVTQNRPMASAMGIATARVDALTFGLGSGIAGIAGVALSQIGNVSPNLGTIYIIDSFMVVVFGGVGNLAGTLVGALTLGVANKLLEPLAGAVLGKVLVLVAIILFIQKRPRGLFALKGRSVEA